MLRPLASLSLALCLPLTFADAAFAQAPKAAPATRHATGTFEVKVLPQKADNPLAEAAGFGRYALDKRYLGDLVGTGAGEMLAAGKGEKGSSGAAVALERVTGTLQGRTGAFALQLSGTMVRGAATMTVTVVPDSGTGQLAGIEGKLTIVIAEGKHTYAFDYTLPSLP